MTMRTLEPAEHTFTSTELFLFSAVSWHPHRIHFDQDYTRDTEGHPDLLVHGPLQAIHLVRYLTERLGSGQVVSVESRHLAPLHIGVPATIEGAEVAADDADSSADTTVFEVWMTRDGDKQTTVCRITVRAEA